MNAAGLCGKSHFTNHIMRLHIRHYLLVFCSTCGCCNRLTTFLVVKILVNNPFSVINVTRGKIVDEQALMDALRSGAIGGAGLDVTPQEPLPEAHPLWRMANVIVTPHAAGGSPNRVDRIVDLFCDNLRRILADQPLLSVIDKKKGY